MAGHGRGAVVEDDGDGVAPVVGYVEQGGHPRVEEGGVADGGHVALFRSFRVQSRVRPVSHADAGPHAATGVQGREGRQEGQGVAADVAVDHQFELFGHVEDAAMGAAGTEDGGTPRKGTLLWLPHLHPGRLRQ